MGFTTSKKSEASEETVNFALFWDKYGTFFILAIIVAIFGLLSSEYFLTTKYYPDFVQARDGTDRHGGIFSHPGRRYRPSVGAILALRHG